MRLIDDLETLWFDFVSDEYLTLEQCQRSLDNYVNKFMIQYKLSADEMNKFRKWIDGYFRTALKEELEQNKLEQIKEDF